MPGFSLKSACKAFKTDVQKGDFDHNLMVDWGRVQKHKNDVVKYLKADVMTLTELTEKYVDSCEHDYDASPTKYLTLPSYADNVWKSTIDEDETIIEIPDMTKQHFIGRSVYGGRTYPCR